MDEVEVASANTLNSFSKIPFKVSLFIYLISLFCTALLSGGGVFLWMQYNQNQIKKCFEIDNLQNDKQSSVTLVPTITPTKEVRNFSEIVDSFKAVSRNEIVYKTMEGGVEVFGREDRDDLSKYMPELTVPVYLSVTVYKYKEGAKLSFLYESREFVVDLDKWKKWLQNLKTGENKVTIVCYNWWGCLNESATVIVKNINTNRYIVYDGIEPNVGFLRQYSAYDDVNKRIINIKLTNEATPQDIDEIPKLYAKIEKLLP